MCTVFCMCGRKMRFSMVRPSTWYCHTGKPASSRNSARYPVPRASGASPRRSRPPISMPPAVAQAHLLGEMTEHDDAAERRRQRRDEKAVVAPGDHARHRAGRIAAEAVGDQPFARDRTPPDRARRPAAATAIRRMRVSHVDHRCSWSSAPTRFRRRREHQSRISPGSSPVGVPWPRCRASRCRRTRVFARPASCQSAAAGGASRGSANDGESRSRVRGSRSGSDRRACPSEEPERKRLRRKHRPVHAGASLRAKRGILPPQLSRS